jgi:predicted transcriptional regulator
MRQNQKLSPRLYFFSGLTKVFVDMTKDFVNNPSRPADKRSSMPKRKEKNVARPTDLELSILRVLWKRGRGSVREILQDYNSGRDDAAGYTTILKMLQIMTERDDSVRPQIYWTSQSQHQTQRQLVNDLLEKAFEGSAKQLVMQALSARTASEEELAEVERLLDKLEGEER